MSGTSLPRPGSSMPNTNNDQHIRGWAFKLIAGITQYRWVREHYPTLIQDAIIEYPIVVPKILLFSNMSTKNLVYYIYPGVTDLHGVKSKGSMHPLDIIEARAATAHHWVTPPHGYRINILGPEVNGDGKKTETEDNVLWAGFQVTNLQGAFIAFSENNGQVEVDYSEHPALRPGHWCQFQNETRHTLQPVILRPGNALGTVSTGGVKNLNLVPDVPCTTTARDIILPFGTYEFVVPSDFYCVEIGECLNTELGQRGGRGTSGWSGSNLTSSEFPSGDARTVIDTAFIQRRQVLVNFATNNSSQASASLVVDYNAIMPVSDLLANTPSGVVHFGNSRAIAT